MALSKYELEKLKRLRDLEIYGGMLVGFLGLISLLINPLTGVTTIAIGGSFVLRGLHLDNIYLKPENLPKQK